MRILLQRVSRASVQINSKPVGVINYGYLLFVGFSKEDSDQIVHEMVDKVTHLRVMADAEGKMNRSILDVQGEVLVVSQFTLYADTSKGRRPYFGEAAEPIRAKKLYELFIQKLEITGLKVETGEFGAHMQVSLVNDGPVTIVLKND